MENKDLIFENFKKAVSAIWLRDGQNTWPIDLNAISHLYMDGFAKELTADIARLKEQSEKGEVQRANNNLTQTQITDTPRSGGKKEIAEMFQTSARIIRLMMPYVLGMKTLRLPLDQLQENLLFLFSLVEHVKYGDIFNRDGKNTVLSPQKFTDTIDPSKLILTKGDRRLAITIQKLCAVLWNYAETLCFKVHGLIREFHGPYSFPGSNEEIVLRDFYCLKPLQLWSECAPVEYNTLRVVTAYEDLGITIDIYNNIFIREGGSYTGALKSYTIEADGKPLNMDEVNRLCVTLSQIMLDITTKVEQMDWKERAKKYAEIFWFSKKELRDALNEDWKPSREVMNRIETGELSTRLTNLDPRDLQRMLRISF